MRDKVRRIACRRKQREHRPVNGETKGGKAQGDQDRCPRQRRPAFRRGVFSHEDQRGGQNAAAYGQERQHDRLGETNRCERLRPQRADNGEIGQANQHLGQVEQAERRCSPRKGPGGDVR